MRTGTEILNEKYRDFLIKVFSEKIKANRGEITSEDFSEFYLRESKFLKQCFYVQRNPYSAFSIVFNGDTSCRDFGPFITHENFEEFEDKSFILHSLDPESRSTIEGCLRGTGLKEQSANYLEVGLLGQKFCLVQDLSSKTETLSLSEFYKSYSEETSSDSFDPRDCIFFSPSAEDFIKENRINFGGFEENLQHVHKCLEKGELMVSLTFDRVFGNHFKFFNHCDNIYEGDGSALVSCGESDEKNWIFLRDEQDRPVIPVSLLLESGFEIVKHSLYLGDELISHKYKFAEAKGV